MKERCDEFDSLSARVKSQKDTLLSCINKVLARQLLRRMQSRMRRNETFDASPPQFTGGIETIGEGLPLSTNPGTTVDSNRVV